MSFNKDFEALKNDIKLPQKDYASAKLHAADLDLRLGYECKKIEDALFDIHHDSIIASPRQFWYGLDIQSMQTPYSEIVEMVSLLQPKPGDLWLDLGAAYGRIGIVLGFLNPEVQFIGYEYVADRVREGNRIFSNWHLAHSRMQEVDLATEDFKLESADLYFLYDFGSKKDVYKILQSLSEIAIKKPIRIIARGRGVRNWILMDFPCLYEIQPAQHFAHWSLFRT